MGNGERHYFVFFPFIENKYFISYNISRLQFPLPLLFPVPTNLSSHWDSLTFCLSLEKNGLLRDNEQAWQSKIYKIKTKTIRQKWAKENQQKKNIPKSRHKEKRPTHSHIQKTHKNIKLKAMLYIFTSPGTDRCWPCVHCQKTLFHFILSSLREVRAGIQTEQESGGTKWNRSHGRMLIIDCSAWFTRVFC